MAKYWFLPLLVALFGSCAKTQTIGGRVVNYETGQPVEGVSMNLERVKSSGIIGLIDIQKGKHIGQTLSNGSGDFSFETRVKNSDRFAYYLSLNQVNESFPVDTTAEMDEWYFVQTPADNRINAKGKDASACIFEVMPAARLKVVPVDVEPFGAYESFEATAGAAFLPQPHAVFNSKTAQPSYARVPTYKTVFIRYRYKLQGIFQEGAIETTLAPFKKNVVYLYY